MQCGYRACPDGYQLDVRTKASDEHSSIVISKNNIVAGNKGRVMVSEDAEGNSVTILLLDANGVIIDKKLTTRWIKIFVMELDNIDRVAASALRGIS